MISNYMDVLNPTLSILICSIPERKDMLKTLLTNLSMQVGARQNVEILVNKDDGTKPIGQKRNELIEVAAGDYLCFIDDDDRVSKKYVNLILEASKEDADCIELNLEITTNGENPRRAHHSLEYNQWGTVKDDKGEEYYQRTPNHLNPIRRLIAQKVKFPEVNHGEDHAWSNEVVPYLKTEAKIPETIYFYQYKTNKENK